MKAWSHTRAKMRRAYFRIHRRRVFDMAIAATVRRVIEKASDVTLQFAHMAVTCGDASHAFAQFRLAELRYRIMKAGLPSAAVIRAMRQPKD